MPDPQGSSSTAISPVSATRLKLEQFIGTFLATQAMTWLAAYTQWQVGDFTFSMILTAVLSIPTSIAASLAMIFLVRVYRLVNTLNAYAQQAESEIAGVAMKTDLAAAEYQGSKVVGPTDLPDLAHP